MRLAALLALVLIVSACGSGLPAPPPGYERIGHVADGDTVVLQSGATIRLVQIDTPEVFFRPECFGSRPAPRRSGSSRRTLSCGSSGTRPPIPPISTDASCATSSARTGSTSTSSSSPTALRRRTSSRAIGRQGPGARATRARGAARASRPLGRLPVNRLCPGTRRRHRAAAVVSRRAPRAARCPSSICDSSTRLNDSRTLSPPRPSGKKSVPGTMPTPPLDRAARELGRVGAVGQRQPGEEATLRRRPVHAGGHVALERGEHPLALALVERARRGELLVDPAAADVLLEQPLAERAGALVGVLLRARAARETSAGATAQPSRTPGKNVFDVVPTCTTTSGRQAPEARRRRRRRSRARGRRRPRRSGSRTAGRARRAPRAARRERLTPAGFW